MTRASKRKSDHQNSEPVKSNRVDSVHSASSKAATKVEQRIDKLYTKYANTSSCVIEPEGIEALCSDLKVDFTDVRILMLAWKMNAQKQGYFTQDEWRRGLKALQVDTISKLKKTLPELEKEVASSLKYSFVDVLDCLGTCGDLFKFVDEKALKSENFNNFYNFSFRYCLTEERQKCLDIETSCVLLKLVLVSRYQSQVDSFIKFLKIQCEYKAINIDQWTNFLRFCQEISFPGFENYDTSEAWPFLLDNFVDWMKQNQI